MIVPNLPQTTEAVAAHYDELDPFYRDVWGDHVHHGYWATGRETPTQAVEALVDLMAERLHLAAGLTVCDIGCGYGAAARHLADRYGVAVAGMTVSVAQAAYATRNFMGRPSQPRRDDRLQDWLFNDFPNASFDRAYAIESSEHMQDKQRFFDEAFRTLRPGGLLGVCAWLARPAPRPWEVRHLLEPICREGRLPSLGDAADYKKFAERAGFRIDSLEDLSQGVRRTWSLCLRRVLGKIVSDPRYRRYLMESSASNQISRAYTGPPADRLPGAVDMLLSHRAA